LLLYYKKAFSVEGIIVMAKILKISLIICVFAAFSFAETSTAPKQQTPIQVSTKTADTVTNAGSFKLPTGVVPKQPTNWSKIKDLFL